MRRVLLLGALLPIVAFCGWLLLGNADRTFLGSQTDSIRATRLGEEALRLMVDEESGVRGYTSTGSKLFLAPYLAARRPLGVQLALLQTDAERWGDPKVLELVGDIRNRHRLWVQQVAAPLIRQDPPAPDLRRQALGKRYMDGVRADFASLQRVVGAQATVNDRRQHILVSLVTATLVGLVVVIGFVFIRDRNSRAIVRDRRARTLAFLARSSDLLSSSLDVEQTIASLLNVVVEEMAEWCSIYVYVEGSHELRCTAVAHRDPQKRLRLEAFQRRHPNRLPASVSIVAATGEPLLFECHPVVEFDSVDADRDAFIQQELDPGSVMLAPMCADGNLVGVLVLANSRNSRVFTLSDLEICAAITLRAATALRFAQRHRHEEKVATTLQTAAQPANIPQIDGFVFSALYAPGNDEAHVGGDWYDVFVLNDGRVVVTIGDVSGNGLEAAVIMMSVRQWFRALAQSNPDPSTMLDAADRALRAEFPDMVVTTFVMLLDPATQTLSYASAGHPAPVLRNADGTLDALGGVGLPLGVREGDEPKTATIDVIDGSTIVLYTDGLIESTRDVIEGERSLRVAVASRAMRSAAHPAQYIHDAVFANGPARDDVAIVTVRVEGSFRLLPARPHVPTGVTSEIGTAYHRWGFDVRDERSAWAVRTSLVDFLKTRGASREDCVSAETVYSELVGNVLRHATGYADVQVHWNGPFPVLDVFDEGPGFSRAPRLPADPFAESGRGLFIVASLAETFSAERRRGCAGTHCRAVLALSRKRLSRVAHPTVNDWEVPRIPAENLLTPA